MNVFVIGRNAPESIRMKAIAELKSLLNIFPTLDPATFWSVQYDKDLFAAAISPSPNQVRPRNYAAHRKDGVTLYDGCIIDSLNRFHPWDAKDLFQHWNELLGQIEGHYVAVNIDGKARSLAIQTDILGIYQVYYIKTNDYWLFSNNLRILSKACELDEWDHLGTSLYLGIGWASGDRTLVKGIKVFPPGERWVWKKNSRLPDCINYFPRSSLIKTHHRSKLNQNDVEALAESLISIFRSVHNNLGPIECPITGGRDSRAMVALLVRGGIEARYFTGGDQDWPDVIIGKAVAARLGVSHRFQFDDIARMIETWGQVWRRNVLERDGMVSLALADYGLEPVEAKRQWFVSLYGIGGEIARGYYYQDSRRYLLSANQFGYVQERMLRRLPRSSDLLRESVRQEVSAFVEQFFRDAVEEGFEPMDIPDLFYAYERVRRWAATNIGTLWSREDVFTPFCTRPFVTAAFSLPLARRVSEHLHYELLNYLTPELGDVPFLSDWHTQQPFRIYFDAIAQPIKGRIERYITQRRASAKKSKYLESGSARDRSRLLEAILPEVRELCLDQKKSSLWNYVDRERFDSLLSTRTAPHERFLNHAVLLDIATLFYYESTRQSPITLSNGSKKSY